MRKLHHFNAVFFSDKYNHPSIKVSEIIVAARLWRNLGFKAAKGYMQRSGWFDEQSMRLVRLACQLEAVARAERQQALMSDF